MALKGRNYVAVVRLSTKDDTTLAEPGATCERIPDTSLPWLIEQGLIVLASDAASVVDEPAEAPAPVEEGE